MSRFDETVTKIAASQVKTALIAQLPALLNADSKPKVGKHAERALAKEAGVFEHVFGHGKEISGAQTIARAIAGGVGTAAVIGGGTYAVGRALDKANAASETLTSQRQQIGKLKGEQTFRHSLNAKLAPMHVKVFAAIKKDPVIAKADHALIHSSYETMKRFAPHLAADENAARSFLRENAIYGTGPSYASLKNLADAEQSVGKASGLGG